MAHHEEDALLKNVADLRKRLIQTERNLQFLQTPGRQRYDYDLSDNDLMDQDEHLPPLTLEDLTPEHLTSSVSSLRSSENEYGRRQRRKPRAMTSDPGIGKQSNRETYDPEYDAGHRALRTSSLSAMMGSATLQESAENGRLRRKLQSIRDENAQLVTENHTLQNKIESCQYELRMTKGQLRMTSLEVESKQSTILNLEEKCNSLRGELKANDSALRMAEQSLEESGRQLSERETLVHRHRQEMKKIRAELVEEQELRNRMEAQRDATIQNMEELSRELEEYKLQTQEQLNKISSAEDHLRGSLLHCDKEREELLERATSLEEELQDARDHIRSLQEVSTCLAHTEAALGEARLKTQEQNETIHQLETELETKQRENKELLDLTEHQSERLADCQRDIETSRHQLQKLEEMVAKLKGREVRQQSMNDSGFSATSDPTSLQSGGAARKSSFAELSDNENKAVIADLRLKLAMKDAEIQRLQSGQHQMKLSSSHDLNVGGATGLRAQLAALVEKNKLGDNKSQELEALIGWLESEGIRQTNEIDRLRQDLAKSEAQRSSVESRMALRDVQLAQLHNEIQDKANQIAEAEKELKKSKGQISALEGQLDEKAASFSSHVSKLKELQAELEAKSSQLAEKEQLLTNQKTDESQNKAKLNEIQSLHREQCQELQQQLELLGQRVDKQSMEVQDLQESKSKLQREVNQKDERLAHLQSDLAESQKEIIKKTVENQQLWNTLQNKADEGTVRLAQLEAALVVCKQELTMYIEQLEEMKKRSEQEMKVKEKEVGELEERLHKATVEMEERGNHAAELEQALRERQKMLQQSTERISELEDREGQLEHQVSSLAKELSMLRTAAIQEAQAMEKKLHQACLDLEDRSHQLRETTQSLSATQSELKQSRAEVQDLEQKLREARRDGDNQGEKTSQLEAELHTAKVKVDSLETTVKELEEVLEKTQEESKQYKQRGQQLDSELERGQADLRAAATQLGELHRLLQRSKAEAKTKQDRVQELSETLRKSQEDVKNKERDIAEMDDALRASQRQLLQRSAQVSQLDVTVKERQSEMERQILELETSLNKTQYQLKQSKQKNADLEERYEKQQQDSHTRALQTQQLEQTIQRQQNDVSLKAEKVTELEKRIEELTNHLKEQKQEYLEQGQQLRLSREQMQQLHVNVTELQRQLAQAQRQQDNLSHELDDALEASTNKEAALARVSEELGAARAQELALQAQYTAELQQIAKLRDAEIEQRDDELIQLQESHARLLASRDQLDSTHRLDVVQLREAEVKAQQELKEARSRVADLEADLAACKEVIEASNEAIVIKESEIARLKARVSGYERTILASQRGTQTTPPFSLGSHHDDSSLLMSPTSSLKHSFAEVRLSSPTGDSGGGSPTKLNFATQQILHTTFEKSSIRRTPPSPNIDAAKRLVNGDYSHLLSPAKKDSTKELAWKDYSPSHADTSKPEKVHVKFDNVTDAFSDVTDANSGISGVDRLPDNEPQTFQAMLNFVNQQITAEKAAGLAHDTSWLNLSGSYTDDLTLTPTHSSPNSTNLTASSFSPPTPLKSAISTPSHSAPSTPASTRRKSGIPRRKGPSPGRRMLHFPRGANNMSTTGNSSHSRKPKGGKVPQPNSADRDKESTETTPLKQKLANQRAKLASRGKTKPVDSSQLKPKECLADLKEKLRSNDMRRLKIDEELFGLREKTRSAAQQAQTNQIKN